MPFPWPPALCRQEGLEAIGKALEDTIWGEAGGKGGISKATTSSVVQTLSTATCVSIIAGLPRSQNSQVSPLVKHTVARMVGKLVTWGLMLLRDKVASDRAQEFTPLPAEVMKCGESEGWRASWHLKSF